MLVRSLTHKCLAVTLRFLRRARPTHGRPGRIDAAAHPTRQSPATHGLVAVVRRRRLWCATATRIPIRIPNHTRIHGLNYLRRNTTVLHRPCRRCRRSIRLRIMHRRRQATPPVNRRGNAPLRVMRSLPPLPPATMHRLPTAAALESPAVAASAAAVLAVAVMLVVVLASGVVTAEIVTIIMSTHL